MRNAAATLAIAACVAVACSAATPVEEDSPPQTKEAKANMSEPPPANGVANLPFARGRTFRSLDDYLAHLEANAAIDLPYWRETRPGVYQWTVRMPEAGEGEIATRDELMRRYGFTR